MWNDYPAGDLHTVQGYAGNGALASILNPDCTGPGLAENWIAYLLDQNLITVQDLIKHGVKLWGMFAGTQPAVLDTGAFVATPLILADYAIAFVRTYTGPVSARLVDEYVSYCSGAVEYATINDDRQCYRSLAGGLRINLGGLVVTVCMMDTDRYRCHIDPVYDGKHEPGIGSEIDHRHRLASAIVQSAYVAGGVP